MKIAIGGDHAGYQYKESIKLQLSDWGHEVVDFGPNSADSVDYPDYIHPLAEAVEKKDCIFGVAICGSGNGVAMTANKHTDIRAALCWNTRLAQLARAHNDANVLCLPARFIALEWAKEITAVFLNTSFEGGRHQRRIDKIYC